MSRESKCELTDRLRREGRFDEFKKRREELKAEGIRAKYAWYQAAVEFPPEHLTLAAESLIPWSKARRSVNAAKSDISWLLRAIDVDVPRRVGARNPALYGYLQLLRSDPVLRRDFCFHVIKMWAAKPNMFKDEASRRPQNLRPWEVGRV